MSREDNLIKATLSLINNNDDVLFYSDLINSIAEIKDKDGNTVIHYLALKDFWNIIYLDKIYLKIIGDVGLNPIQLLTVRGNIHGIFHPYLITRSDVDKMKLSYSFFNQDTRQDLLWLFKTFPFLNKNLHITEMIDYIMYTKVSDFIIDHVID